MRQGLKNIRAMAVIALAGVSIIVLHVRAANIPREPPAQTPPALWNSPLTNVQKAELLLRRITFGPRPGDVALVEEMGVSKFLDQQLHPASLNDSALDAKLEGLTTLTMPSSQLADDVREARQHERVRRLAVLRGQEAGSAAPLRPGFRRFGAMSGPARAVPAGPGEEVDEVSGPSGESAMSDEAPAFKPREILTQLGQEELLRAVYSRRQLQEVMVRFWMNHFNIYWNKGADQYYLTSFEQNVIRPHALGNFEDLLVATAESPAMLFYLDNWMSVAPNAQREPRPEPRPFEPFMAGPGMYRPFGPFFRRPLPQARRPKNRRGLNENYGRELMELHTIGLHYTQQDVIEVARCFTGWTIRKPGQGGGFYFNPRLHDFGKKVVLGYEIPAGQGIEDGLEVLHILAMSPYTAQHVAYELCQKFVADNPPPQLVERAAKVYLATRGDIPSVLQAILTSPEFYSQASYQGKIKSPFEYVASTLRALNVQTDGSPRLLAMISQMGEPMFQYEEPSGYDDVAQTWINSGALLARMNFAIALALGRIPGTTVDWQEISRLADGEPPRMMMNQLAWRLTGDQLSPATENAILSKLASGAKDGWAGFKPGQQTRMLASLLIASPEFQRR